MAKTAVKEEQEAEIISMGKKTEVAELGNYISKLKDKYSGKSPNSIIAALKAKKWSKAQINQKMKEIGLDVYGSMQGIISRILVLLQHDIRSELKLTELFTSAGIKGRRNAAIMGSIYEKDEKIMKELKEIRDKWQNVAQTGKPGMFGWGKLGRKSIVHPFESIEEREIELMAEADSICKEISKYSERRRFVA